MSEPRILGLGRAVPMNRYPQSALHARNPWKDSPLIDRLFLDSPVQTRALFVSPEWYDSPRSLTDTNQAWLEGAMLLGGQALTDALAAAECPPSSLDMLGVTTVTGYATPGLDLRLAQEHGLRPNLARAHFNCIGCHAAIPLLRVAADYVRARPAETAAALAVEICSACFSRDPSPQNLVALALFADGAAAAVVGTGTEGPILVDFTSSYDFDHIDALGFGLTTSGFRITLDPSIPDIIAANIEGAVDTLLDQNGIRRSDVSTWCFHPGGSRILDAVQRNLKLTDGHMRPSRRVLANYGNMSSPSIFFALAEALDERPPPDGSFGILAAFGPGLGIEAALMRFE
jgi:alkylresorcinol/alkylpyrone synthase